MEEDGLKMHMLYEKYMQSIQESAVRFVVTPYYDDSKEIKEVNIPILVLVGKRKAGVTLASFLLSEILFSSFIDCEEEIEELIKDSKRSRNPFNPNCVRRSILGDITKGISKETVKQLKNEDGLNLMIVDTFDKNTIEELKKFTNVFVLKIDRNPNKLLAAKKNSLVDELEVDATIYNGGTYAPFIKKLIQFTKKYYKHLEKNNIKWKSNKSHNILESLL